jgi:hypothetical protein
MMTEQVVRGKVYSSINSSRLNSMSSTSITWWWVRVTGSLDDA